MNSNEKMKTMQSTINSWSKMSHNKRQDNCIKIFDSSTYAAASFCSLE